MKRNKILKEAGVLLIVAAMVLSTVVVTANTTKLQTESLMTHITSQGSKYQGDNRGVILWDNGMHYSGLVSCQWDATSGLDSLAADDFHFEVTTVISDVHWISGYWNPGEDGDFDWNVSFYMDRGDGNAPGAKIYKQVFPNAEVHETFIEEISGTLYFSYWVDLADPIPFTGGEKYWISIQGVGAFPPQSGMAGHNDTIVLHQGAFKSVYFGYPDWVNIEEILDVPADGCFQLTGDGEPVVPDLDCDGDLLWDEVTPGAKVNGTFVVINAGDTGSMLEWEVAEYPKDWGTNWTFIPDGGFVGTTTSEEVFVEVEAPDEKNEEFEGDIVLVNSKNAADTCSIHIILKTPRSRAFNTFPLFLRFLENHPYMFPMLRQLLGL